jgi:CRP-like cAMP-binding protein
MINYRQIARSAPIFEGLTELEKSDLLKDGKVRYINKKEFLFHHGDNLRSFYIICFGAIQLFRSNVDGGEKTINILTAHDTLCSDRICDPHSTHQFSAIAISDAVVLEFSKAWLKESVKKCSNFAVSLLAVISHRVHEAELEAEKQATMSAVQLVSCFLHELCLLHDFDPRGFELPYSKKLIASRLGMEMETFSRTLPKLRKLGITVAGAHVRIKNFNTVVESASGYLSDERIISS